MPKKNSAKRGLLATEIGPLRKLSLSVGAGATVTGGAALALLAFASSANASTTITVDNAGDGAPNAANCTDLVAGNCTLRDASLAALDGDVVVFDPAISSIALTVESPIDLYAISLLGPGSSALTISSAGAPGDFDLFQIDGTGNAVISGLTLTGNRIYAENEGNLLVSDTTITGSASSYGGALYAANEGTVTIEDSVFSDNTASARGGAVYLHNLDAVTISNSTFSNNNSDLGGAIYGRLIDDFSLSNSQVSGNEVSGNGGGLALGDGVSGSIAITNTTFDSNSATYGGGLYVAAGVESIISNSTFSNNQAMFGGGLRLSGAEASTTINNSTIASNAAYLGGGIGLTNGGYLTLNQTTISANSATISGGGIASLEAANVITMTGSIVSGNSADTEILDIFLNADSATLNSTNSLLGDIDPSFVHISTNDVMTTNPMLGPLANNGGLTQTMLPLSGSPAIDAGPNPVASFAGNGFDQRGAPWLRIYGNSADIGAVEGQPEPGPTPNPEPVVPIFTG